MAGDASQPQVFDLLAGDAIESWATAFGTTGRIFRGEGIDAVWVSKQGEAIDPGWFSQPTVDLLLVVRGHLRVEFADPALPARTLRTGELLVLPAHTRCRAYRWPRDAADATVFFAVYPQQNGHRRSPGGPIDRHGQLHG